MMTVGFKGLKVFVKLLLTYYKYLRIT